MISSFIKVMSSIVNDLKMEYACMNTIISNLTVQLENAKKRRDFLFRELTILEVRRELNNKTQSKRENQLTCMN